MGATLEGHAALAAFHGRHSVIYFTLSPLAVSRDFGALPFCPAGELAQEPGRRSATSERTFGTSERTFGLHLRALSFHF